MRTGAVHRSGAQFHMNCTAPSRGWCGSGAVRRTSAAPSVEPSTEPQARADAPAASYGMTAASPCRSPRTRRARSPRSAAAKAAGSRQRFAGCRVGEYMSSGVWRVPSFDRGNKSGRTNKRPTLPVVSCLTQSQTAAAQQTAHRKRRAGQEELDREREPSKVLTQVSDVRHGAVSSPQV